MNEYAHLELHDRAIRFKYQRASLLLFGHSSIWKDTCFGDHSSFYDHHASSAINYLSELATFHVFSFYVLCLLSHVKLHPSANPQQASCWRGFYSCEDYGVPASEVKQKVVFWHTEPRKDSERSKKEKAPGLPRLKRKAT
jgi:hypothetical protein